MGGADLVAAILSRLISSPWVGGLVRGGESERERKKNFFHFNFHKLVHRGRVLLMRGWLLVCVLLLVWVLLLVVWVLLVWVIVFSGGNNSITT
mmetsp:Transcript_8213/g.12410  ORF Transcript_8213/g.12410 Transcript_8213/m.12410 type:complete len:93 (-) Transcript_8213:1519-1797(-)